MSESRSDHMLPRSQDGQPYVSVSALQGGFLTLPENLFITDADPGKRATVPSLSFLIQHPAPDAAMSASSPSTRLVFDLGLKRDLESYALAQRHHITQRQPVVVSPDVAESLRVGGLSPEKDIDEIIVSHVQ